MTSAAFPVQADVALPYRRVLVTGGSGFVGGHLLARLLEQLTPEARIIRGGRGEAGTDILLDLANPPGIRQAVEAVRPDLVLHLAGEASVATAAGAAAERWHINLAGSLALADAVGDVSPDSTFLFASSAEVYGLAFLDGDVDEVTVPQPIAVYGQSKLAAEHMLATVLPASATLIVARPTNHIGPRQGERFAIASFAKQLVENERLSRPALIRVGNLNAQRDFMDVRDVVSAYIALLRLQLDPGARELFNISSGTLHSLRYMLDSLRSATAVLSEVVVDNERFRPNEIERAAVNADRIRLLTGWKPIISVERSLRDVLCDWRERNNDDLTLDERHMTERET